MLFQLSTHVRDLVLQGWIVRTQQLLIRIMLRMALLTIQKFFEILDSGTDGWGIVGFFVIGFGESNLRHIISGSDRLLR